jgi:ankyrin repeat protein
MDIKKYAWVLLFLAALFAVPFGIMGCGTEQDDWARTIDLYLAAQDGDYQQARRLLQDGADIDVNAGFVCNATICLGTPLHASAYFGHTKVAALLVLAGADVNARTKSFLGTEKGYRGTPLHYAALGGDLQMTRLLLSCGADPHLPDGNGQTAFDLAAEVGHARVAWLLKHKMDR